MGIITLLVWLGMVHMWYEWGVGWVDRYARNGDGIMGY